ncbi:GAF domain-containing protein [Methylobacterium sp. CM6246]
MTTIPYAVTDPARLAALAAYDILDTLPEQGFDDVVRLATRLCATPVALVSLVAIDRQWFKARVGFPHCETDLDSSVCKFALVEPDLLVIPDLTADPRTMANPLVTGEPYIRFYAGAPLRSLEGQVLGSLCVIDTAPRAKGLTPEQADDLRALGRQVASLLEMRRAVEGRDQVLEQQRFELRQARRIEVLAKASQALLTATDPAAVLDPILSESAGALGFDRSYTYDIWQDGGHLRLTHSLNATDEVQAFLHRMPYGAPLCGIVAEQRQPLMLTDVQHSEEPAYQTARSIGLNAYAGFPIMSRGSLRGVISFASTQTPMFDTDALAFFETLARLMSAVYERLDSEKALRESDTRSRLAQEAGHVGTFEVAVDTGLMSVSPEFARIYGVPPADLYSTERFEALVVLEDRGILSNDETRRAGTAARDVEYRIHRADDDELRWIARRGSFVCDEAGRVVRMFGTVQDITDRYETQEALRVSEGLARKNAERVQLALAAGAIIGTWHWDLPSDRFTVDEAFATAFGLDPALGRDGIPLAKIVATVHPDDQAGLSDAIGEVIVRGGAYAHQYRTRRADGNYYWLEANGRVEHAPDGTPLSFPGVLIDVEERRAIEAERDRVAAALRDLNATLEQRIEERTEEVRAYAARQRVIFDSTRQLMGRVDLDGSLLDANHAALNAIGAELADVVGQPFPQTPWFTGTPGMAEVVAGALEAVNRGERMRAELPLVMPDGGTRIYDFLMNPVLNETGRVIEIMPEATDITEQRQAEESLRQSQKMEAVGQLTGGLAHDFNNLLAGISGSLELMQTRMGQGRLGDLDRYMSVAQGATKRAAALTHRLLAFSRRQTLDPKPTNVNRLVADMEELIRRTIGPEIALETVGSASLWPTLIDPGQLENALLNLCINARDVMPDGGRIVIETANKWLDRPAAIQHEIPEGQYLSLCVTDTGCGMTPEVIARVFEPFFTTKPMGQGTGLGLSMVYGFARQSGGQVRIYSEVGEGTTVCLYLPRHYGETEEDDAIVRLTEAERAGQGETVLIVDDEPSVRMLVTEVLEDLGYTAIEAGDSVAGLKALQSDVRIDLLVTDVGLPGGMNGRQMADAGRERRPNLKVLFITGYAENAAVGNGHLAPGMQVLTKPFAMEALASRIKELITSQ